MTLAVANWLVGLALVTIAVLKLLWGADLMATECLASPWRWRSWAHSGSFWLGVYFVLTAIVPYGVIGIQLLNAPGETVIAAYAVPILAGGITAGLAWYFLAGEKK